LQGGEDQRGLVVLLGIGHQGGGEKLWEQKAGFHLWKCWAFVAFLYKKTVIAQPFFRTH